MDYVLETENLCKNYGHFQALDHLTMRVPKGAVYGLVGKNGAGKTTLIRVICGLQQPSAGSYTLCGVPYGSRAVCAAAWVLWWKHPPSTPIRQRRKT